MRILVAFFALAALSFGLEPDAESLGSVKRVYVESLGASPQAIMLHDMITSSLASSNLIAVTENADRADAVLRGSASDQTFEDEHHTSDSINAGFHGAASDSEGSRYSRSSSSRSRGLTIGQNETMHSVERRHEASVSIRLVNQAGDVIWSTTQESNGGKFRSASADVADKILHKLSDDLQKARSTASAAMQAGMPSR